MHNLFFLKKQTKTFSCENYGPRASKGIHADSLANASAYSLVAIKTNLAIFHWNIASCLSLGTHCLKKTNLCFSLQHLENPITSSIFLMMKFTWSTMLFYTSSTFIGSIVQIARLFCCMEGKYHVENGLNSFVSPGVKACCFHCCCPVKYWSQEV